MVGHPTKWWATRPMSEAIAVLIEYCLLRQRARGVLHSIHIPAPKLGKSMCRAKIMLIGLIIDWYI